MKELLSKPKKKKETKKDFLKDKVDKDLIDSDDEETNDTNDSENNIAEISDRLVTAHHDDSYNIGGTTSECIFESDEY